MADFGHISPDVVIMTRAELRQIEDAAFRRGVQRGKFEATASSPSAQAARNCANYSDGRCERCGVQWQYFEIAPDYKCPHFTARPSARPSKVEE